MAALTVQVFQLLLLFSGTWSMGIYPWQASIQRKGVHECGGAILSSGWVVSSASCFKRHSLSNISEWTVVLARWTQPPTQKVSGIKKVIKHPSYTMEVSGYDIALVQLNAVAFNDSSVNISAIRLPDTSDKFDDGTLCNVTGWGNVHKAGEKQSPARDLRESVVSVVGSGTCNEEFQRRYIPNIIFIQPDMVCTNSSAGLGACTGDTGGPLVCSSSTGIPKLAGILSWNVGCSGESLGVYTSAAAFSTWITNTQTRNV